MVERTELLRRLTRVKMFCMDVDGVLTNGHLYYSKDGELFKCFNAHDGMGIQILREQLGIIPVIITQEETGIVSARARKLKIEHVFQGVRDKGSILAPLLEKLQIGYGEVLFVGDDINDLPLLRRVGVAVAVADAIERIKSEVHYITRSRGGEGAIRELVEMILEARERYG